MTGSLAAATSNVPLADALKGGRVVQGRGQDGSGSGGDGQSHAAGFADLLGNLAGAGGEGSNGSGNVLGNGGAGAGLAGQIPTGAARALLQKLMQTNGMQGTLATALTAVRDGGDTDKANALAELAAALEKSIGASGQGGTDSTDKAGSGAAAGKLADGTVDASTLAALAGQQLQQMIAALTAHSDIKGAVDAAAGAGNGQTGASDALAKIAAALAPQSQGGDVGADKLAANAARMVAGTVAGGSVVTLPRGMAGSKSDPLAAGEGKSVAEARLSGGAGPHVAGSQTPGAVAAAAGAAGSGRQRDGQSDPDGGQATASGSKSTTKVDVVRQETHFAPVVDHPVVQQIADQTAQAFTSGTAVDASAKAAASSASSSVGGLPDTIQLASGSEVKVLHIQLQPADMGTVNVRLAVKDDAVQLHVEAALDQTARLIHDDKDALSRMLSAHGLKVDGLVVSVTSPDQSSSSMGGTDGRSGSQSQSQSFQASEQSSQSGAGSGRASGGGRGSQSGGDARPTRDSERSVTQSGDVYI